METVKKIAMWGTILLGLTGALFGLVKLLSTPPTNPPAKQTSAEAAKEVSPSDWIKGPLQAKVTLVEYSDFQCPACATYYPVLKQLNKEFEDSMQFVYRYFPLKTIHKNAQVASFAAEASGRQGKFWEMHDLLFDNQKEWSDLANPQEKFLDYAKLLGLDTEKFKNDLESKEVKDKVARDYQNGLSATVNATPTFFLNGQKIISPRSYEEFKSKIEEVLK